MFFSTIFVLKKAMQKYKKYHTDIKVSYALGIQNQVLPKYFTNEIPNTTSLYWKQENHQKYIGTDFVQDVRTSLDDTKLFLDQRLVFAKNTFVQFARFYLIILNMIDREVLKKKIKEHKNIIFNQFEKLAEDFPIDKSQLLRFLQISKHQY